MKYQLLHISEILQTWSKFNKSDLGDKISDIRIGLLTNSLEMNQLEEIKSQFWTMIVQSGDNKLYQDLVRYYPSENYSNDPSEMGTSA